MNNEEKILNVLEKMQGQMEGMSNRLDKMDSRLDNMDTRLDNMDLRMDAMQETLTRVSLTQENVVLPRIQLLAEGHTTIMDRMPSKSRIEALEEDVATLKSIVQIHGADIAQLKAAK